MAIASGAWDEAALVYRELGRSAGHTGLKRAMLRRAAEIAEVRATQTVKNLGDDLWTELWTASPADAPSSHALERARLVHGDGGRLVVQLELGARHSPPGESKARRLRAASAVAEARQGDVDAAIRLRRESLPSDDLAGHEELARLTRRQNDRSRTAQVYRRCGLLAHDARVAAAYLSVAGLLDVATGQLREAEEALRAALGRTPDDVAAHLGLANILRRSARWRDLAVELEALAPLAASGGLRAQALRELGRLTAVRLGDATAARAHLERALELLPDDSAILQALAELVGEAGDWPQAVQLRERALATADPARGAQLLFEIGDIAERHNKDDDAARSAFERALALDAGHLGAVRALAQLHRRHKRGGELLRILRRELELLPPEEVGTRLGLLLEIARNAEQIEGETGSAVDAYLAALAVEPTSSPALAGLERLCRRENRWDILVQALRMAPRTPRTTRVLAEALEKLERWRELAELRRVEIDGLPETAGPPERKETARAAMALGQLLEERIGDPEEAIRAYRRAWELDPTDFRPLRALARLYEERQRWPELVAVLEAEHRLVASSAPGDFSRRGHLLTRIGDLQRDRLDQLGEAATAYEGVLEVEPTNAPAIAALETIYTRLGRDAELLRVLERKGLAEGDVSARSEQFARIADIREKRGDIDGSIASYRQAFLADPANRTTFTALERLCYKRERWREVMELYDAAIELVESGKSRAYRLGDLYARKGQVQLQNLGQPGEAAASYLRVIELDPDNDLSLRFLESIFSQQNDWGNLIKAYEKRADLTADDERRIETLRRAARVAAGKLKEPGEAAHLYERILEIDPADSEALDTLERYYEKVKDWNRMVSILTMRLGTSPGGDDAVARLMRIASICEEGLRDEARAVDSYRRILEIAPGNKEALEALGRIYESTEKWPEFIDVTRRLIRITTDRNMKALLYFKCGSVMESKFSKEDDAIRYYDAAIKTSPSCLPAVHGLRDLYRKRQDWGKVIQSLELEVKLWQDDKERAGVFAQIGQVYGDSLGDRDRAVSYFESALAVDPDCLPANRALFELLFDRGEWTRAAPLGQALAQKVMREGDPSERSEFYRKRGLVAAHAGDLRTAAESLIIALEIKPENITALDDLGRLARDEPDAYDFPATYRELEKIYRKRDDSPAHLARVLTAQAGITARAGDLDAAEKVYRDALSLVPQDFAVLSTLVDLHVAMRRYEAAAEVVARFLETKPLPPRETRVAALLRLAEIHGDGEMDAERAANVLREVIRFDPTNQDALYRLAQELYVLGRFPEARQHIEKVIEAAAAPGTAPLAESLARYYYFLGRIYDAMGDARGSGSAYRRASEYDPGYAPTALGLAKRAVAAGERRQAENILIAAAHAAMEKGGQHAAVPLQRGLARILLAAGDREAAIAAYRGILAVEPDSGDDRVALAEIYAMEDLPKAINEVGKVLDRDLRHAPAYRLLAALYERAGEHERATRTTKIIELLGYADAPSEQRAAVTFVGRRSPLTEELRQAYLMPPEGRSLWTELYQTIAPEVTNLFLMPPLGNNLTPAANLDDPAFKLAVSDCSRLHGIEAEVFVADEVHGGMIVVCFPRPLVCLARTMLHRPDAERRFLLGRAYESMRGLYAPLLRLGPRERAEVSKLLGSLLLPEAERPQATQEFVRSINRKAQKALERFAGQKGDGVEPEAWLVALGQAQDRAGLLVSDDFQAAARQLALLSGEELAVTAEGAVALGAVPGGTELVRYYLSDDYHRLRQVLAEPLRGPSFGA
jgi:tetratricopeptide (TPR) repeat protein